MIKRERKKEDQYINPERFMEEMRSFKIKCKEASDAGLERPVIPRYIGQCIKDIAEKLSTSRSFFNYPFREELVSDAMENCVRYIDNFNPDRAAGIPLLGKTDKLSKGANPFSYFSQITYFAFLRRIYNEKKQLYIKHKIMANQIVHYDQLGEDDPSGISYSSLENDKLNTLVEAFEENLSKKRDSRKQMLLDKAFIEALAEQVEEVLED